MQPSHSSSGAFSSPVRDFRSSSSSRAQRRSWGDAMRAAAARRQEDALFRKHMPQQLEELWAAVQDSASLEKIVRLWAGVSLRIPVNMPDDPRHPLRRTLGKRLTARLIAHFGGTTLYVPQCRSFFTKLTHERIIREYSRQLALGSSACLAEQRLALKYGMCDRWIRRLVNRAESDRHTMLSD